MNGFYALARYFYKKKCYSTTILLVTATIALCFCGNNVLMYCGVEAVASI